MRQDRRAGVEEAQAALVIDDGGIVGPARLQECTVAFVIGGDGGIAAVLLSWKKLKALSWW